MSKRLRLSLVAGGLSVVGYLLESASDLVRGYLDPLNFLEVSASLFLAFSVTVFVGLILREKWADAGEAA